MYVPVLGVTVMRLDHDIIGCCRGALVLLRGAHRSHRQLERSVTPEASCGEIIARTQIAASCATWRGTMFMMLFPACKDGRVPSHGNAWPTQLKDSAGLI
jgi:hypothetical protein